MNENIIKRPMPFDEFLGDEEELEIIARRNRINPKYRQPITREEVSKFRPWREDQ